MYVQWGDAKYHRLDQSNCSLYTHQDGSKSVSRGKTQCTKPVPEGSQCISVLPAGTDESTAVCFVCNNGIGVAKPDPMEEKLRSEKAKKDLVKFNANRLAAARKLFD
jgi:polyferredoxin